MVHTHICPHGHQWEASDETRPGPAADASICPVCGAQEAAATAETVESSASSEATLPAPRRAPLAPQTAESSDLTLAPPLKSVRPADPQPDAAAGEGTVFTSPPEIVIEVDAPASATAQTLAPPAAHRPAPAVSDGTLQVSARLNAPSVSASSATLAVRRPDPRPAGPAGEGTEVIGPAPGARPPAARADGTEVIDPAEDGTQRRPRHGAGRPAAPLFEDAPTRPAGAPAATPAVPAGGPAIPGYRVLGELGRGGMGVVYKAEQVGLNRLVAVKMILSGDFAGTDDLARFRQEAESVAKLQHPYIVQVYEIDEVGGKPYFCLEFVDGAPLDKMMAGNPQPARQAAALVEKLAQAMGYAHERHIIHRDLKPANILMTLAGDPKITDFGLAKRLDSEDIQTQTGSVMGTPSYMAPEQAHGRIKDLGPASDIYSLGAILYEALVGRPPFKGETVMDTLDQVRTLEPQPPSRLRPKLPRDLETICLKCLHKEPAKRYAGSGDLAEDLRRFLAGEPIKARPTPVWERAWKWARRRPAWAAVAAAAVLFVLVLIGGGYAWAAEETRLKGVADARAEEALKNRRKAQHHFRQAQDAVGRMLTHVAQEDLLHEPGLDQMRRKLLADALDFNKQFLEENGDDPEVRWEAGRAYMLNGDIHTMLYEQDEAERDYASGRAILAALRGENPDDPAYQRDLAACMNGLGLMLRNAERTPEAESAFREALDLRQKLADDKKLEEDRVNLAMTASSLGELLKDEGRLSEAESLLRRALDLRMELAAASATAEHIQYKVNSYNLLALLLSLQGRLDEADAQCRNAIKSVGTLASKNPGVPDYQCEVAEAEAALAYLWRDTQPKIAEMEYRDAIEILQPLATKYPTVPKYKKSLAATYRNLGLLCQAGGRQGEAQQSYDHALDIEKDVLDSHPTVPEFQLAVGRTLNNAGVLWQTSNQAPKAESYYKDALAKFEKLAADHADVPANQQELANALQNLGVLYTTTNRPDDGAKLLDRAVAIRRFLAEAHPKAPVYQKDSARGDADLGGFWQLNGNIPKAEEYYRQAVDRLEKLVQMQPQVPDNRHMLAYTSHSYGVLLSNAKRFDEAETMLGKAVDLLTALMKEQPSVVAYREELARSYSELGMCRAKNGHDSEGEKALAQALDVLEKLAAEFTKNPVYRQQLAIYLDNLGFLYGQEQRSNDAARSYRRAVDVMEDLQVADPDNPAYWDGLVGPYKNLTNELAASDALSPDLPKYWDRRVGNLRKYAAAYPKAPAIQSEEGAALADMAAWLRERRRLPEALDALKQAVGLQQSAVDLAAPEAKDGFRTLRCDEFLALAETLLALNDRAGAADAVAQLTKVKPAGWPTKENADRFQAVQDALKK